MHDSPSTDADLLNAWLERRHEPSFRALVSRHAGLVNSVAHRKCGNAALAAEASQLTFILLARKAPSLAGRASLAGWLHLTAVRQTQDLLRQSRREHSKRSRFAMETDHEPSSDAWQDIRPVVDEALAALPEKDREALLLRFYRSMSVREVATALGIATDAAQKRIDRATERLRGKLVRSGCLTGGLSAGVLAGFSADAKAAVPSVSVLASHAIAASPEGRLPSKSTAAAATKLKPCVASSVVAILAVTIAVNAHRTSGEKDGGSSSDGAVGRSADSLGTTSRTDSKVSDRPSASKDRIDWRDLAARVEREQDRNLLLEPVARVKAMSRDELAAEYRVIRELHLSKSIEGVFLDLVMDPLLEKSPRMALRFLIDDPPGDTDVWWGPIDAFEAWAKSSPAEAAAWLDEAMASGKSAANASAGKADLQGFLEQKLIGVLLVTDPEAAYRRIGNLPEDLRTAALKEQLIADEHRDSCIVAIREQIPQKDQIELLANLVSKAVEKNGLDDGTAFMNRIDASQEQRISIIRSVANAQADFLARMRQLDVEEIDRLRGWLETMATGQTDRLTGEMISRTMLGGRRFDDLAGLVTH